MTEDHRENLSAAVDGELSGEPLRFLLRRLDHDVALQKAWSNYHAIGDGLRRALPALASPGFAERVLQAVEQDGAAFVADGRRRHWLRLSAGGAIAAGVAVVALMTARPMGDGAAHRAGPATAAVTTRPMAASQSLAATTHVGTPAAVPGWLLDSASMPGLTERASATTSFGTTPGRFAAPYANNLSTYQLPRYRTYNNNDGSYLLLIDADAKQAPPAAQRAPSGAVVH